AVHEGTMEGSPQLYLCLGDVRVFDGCRYPAVVVGYLFCEGGLPTGVKENLLALGGWQRPIGPKRPDDERPPRRVAVCIGEVVVRGAKVAGLQRRQVGRGNVGRASVVLAATR